jgi:hypothetical protein
MFIIAVVGVISLFVNHEMRFTFQQRAIEKEFKRLNIAAQALVKRCNISGDTLGTDSRKKYCHYEYRTIDETKIIAALTAAGYKKTYSSGSVGSPGHTSRYENRSQFMIVKINTKGNSGITFMNMEPL